MGTNQRKYISLMALEKLWFSIYAVANWVEGTQGQEGAAETPSSWSSEPPGGGLSWKSSG